MTVRQSQEPTARKGSGPLASIVARLALAISAYKRARRKRRSGSPGPWLSLPQNTEAVVSSLAGPAIARLSQAAERLQPLTAAAISALESAADLQLAEVTRGLRLQYAALSDRAAADRALWAAIDLPQALRADVQATRGTASGNAT